MPGPLGRLHPPDWDHVSKFPLSALAAVPVEREEAGVPETEDLRPTHVPVAVGANWYEGFDSPEQSGSDFWVGRGPMGSIRGGHCFCLEPAPDPNVKGREQDRLDWWKFYDQGQEGACVGFGCSRVMTLLNRHRYDGEWLYHEAQRIGGYEGQEGAAVRDGLEVLRTEGPSVQHVDESTDAPDPRQGISAYRWITPEEGAQAVLNALGTPSLDYVVILNSWGQAYPHRVKLPATVLDRLMKEAGEVGVVTDR
jgi:hypothetical protein